MVILRGFMLSVTAGADFRRRLAQSYLLSDLETSVTRLFSNGLERKYSCLDRTHQYLVELGKCLLERNEQGAELWHALATRM